MEVPHSKSSFLVLCVASVSLWSTVCRSFGRSVSARGIGPACELSLVDISVVSEKIQTVDVERQYDTERYHLKGIGM